MKKTSTRKSDTGAPRKRKSNKNNKKSKLIKRLSIALAAIVVVAAAALLWLWSITGAKWHGDEPERIYLPNGITQEAMADTLRAHLGDKFAEKTMRLWRWQGGTTEVAHGSYKVMPSTTALAMSRRLLFGKQDPVKATFNNVRTMQQMSERFTRYLEMTPEQFLAACDSLLPPEGFDTANYAAAFLPDTYEFYWNVTPTAAVQRLLDVRNKFWNEERLAKAKQLGLTPQQVCALAAIVEEETAKADEKPMVARLYLNRLDRHMRLQADPTVKFAVGDFSLRRILNKHLEVNSPYNTYKNEGLTPGPIRIVERATIDAVLDAPMHPYVYMCAKEDFSGYHNFATNYADHLANAKRYQAELNKRGIR